MKMMSVCVSVVFALATWNLFLYIGPCHAGIPQKSNYQGKLTDATGKPVSDGDYDMIFSIHDADSAGNLEWSETWETPNAVQVTNGLFNVPLGSIDPTGNPLDLPFNEDYWLQVQVKYDGLYEILLPRQQIVSVGYAYMAENVTAGAITTDALDDDAVTPDKLKVPGIDEITGKVATISSDTFLSLNAAALENLNANNISSGNLGIARLPAGGTWSLTSALGITGANVGIGTTIPGATLHTIGNSIFIESTNGWSCGLTLDTTGDGWDIRASGPLDGFIPPGALGFQTQNNFSNHSVKMVVLNNGNVGIGRTDPGYPLHMGGGAYCTGTAWVNASSREYKENIEKLKKKEAISALWKLKPIKFNYKADKEDKCLGFIGEEVPKLVATKDRKGLSPMEIVALLTRVVQVQQAKIEALEAKHHAGQ